MIPRIEYLRWIDGRPAAATHDLGSSDLRGAGPPVEGVVPETLADVPDPPPEVNLADQVASVYGVDRENVLVTAGNTLANLCAAGAAIRLASPDPDAIVDPPEKDDEDVDRPRVLVEKPGYEPLVATPTALGGRVLRFRRPAEDAFRLDPERVAGAATEDTALVTVTNRHNPSGRAADRETIAAVAEAAAEAGARVLVDEVYAPFVADPGGVEGPTTFGGPTAAGIDNVAVTGSLTKFHGLGPLRVGWLVADTEFVAAARTVADHVPALSTPSEALARRALADRERLDRRARELLATNAALLSAFVDGRPDLAGPVFGGSTYAFLEYEGADGDEVAAAADDRDLLVVPGRFFEAPERFRVSLGRDPEHCEAALSVLGEVLDDL